MGVPRYSLHYSGFQATFVMDNGTMPVFVSISLNQTILGDMINALDTSIFVFT